MGSKRHAEPEIDEIRGRERDLEPVQDLARGIHGPFTPFDHVNQRLVAEAGEQAVILTDVLDGGRVLAGRPDRDQGVDGTHVFRGLGLGVLGRVLHAGGQHQKTEIQARAAMHADRGSIGTRLAAGLDVQPDQVPRARDASLRSGGPVPDRSEQP